jgi:hypothetical protein
MSKRDLIVREFDQADSGMPAFAAESSLSKDWMTQEEDAAWASL